MRTPAIPSLDNAAGYHEVLSGKNPGLSERSFGARCVLGCGSSTRSKQESEPRRQRRIVTLAYALKKYSELLLKAGRSKEAEAAFERGLALYRQDANKLAAGATELNAYAEALVNSPFSRLRNPVLALELAERANGLTKGREPLIVHTLALAYYGNGQVDDAIRTARTALSLLPSATGPSTGLERIFESDIARFESGQKSPR